MTSDTNSRTLYVATALFLQRRGGVKTTGCSKSPCIPRTDPEPERVKAPERTPVREDGFATENAADGTFQHPVTDQD